MKKVSPVSNEFLNKCPKCVMPRNVVPMSLSLANQPFNDKDWQFEIKWDGFRILAYCSKNEVNLSSKRNNTLNKRFPTIKAELERMDLNAVLDGEVVILNEDGSPSFNNIISTKGTGNIVYYVFDVLWYHDRNLLELPLWQRRKVLKSILGKSETVRFSDHVDEKGVELFDLVQEHAVEGIVGKHKQSTYSPGYRSNEWLKIKTGQQIKAVVAGYLLDKNKDAPSSLIIGRKIDNEYRYMGLVEAGVGIQTVKKILEAKRTMRPIFSPLPNVNKKSPFRTPLENPVIVWLKPLECEVKYLELDRFGIMRLPSFKGLT